MSFQSLADVFDYVQTHDDLTTNEVVVLVAIAHHADRAGANAYPTLETLRTFTKLQRRTIQYALRRLEKDQVLKTTLTRGKPGKQTYELLLPHVPLSRGAPHAPHTSQEVHHMHLIPSQEVHHMHPDPGNSKKGQNCAHTRDNGSAREADTSRQISPQVLNYPLRPDKVQWFGLTPGSDAYTAALSNPTPLPVPTLPPAPWNTGPTIAHYYQLAFIIGRFPNDPEEQTTHIRGLRHCLNQRRVEAAQAAEGKGCLLG
jgi:hypothetical protein